MLKHPLLPLMPNRLRVTTLVVVAVNAFGRPCHTVDTAESRHATGAQHLRLFYRHHLQGGTDICLFHIVCSF